MKNLRYYLLKAKDEGFALGSFNFSNLETLQAITNASVSENSPVMIAVSESALKYMGTYVVGLAKSSKEINPNIFLHLDHGKSFEVCKQAVDMGFDSVMIDGSHLDFESNIALTKSVCEYAHARDVLVEGELGQIKGIEDNVSAEKSYFTDPEQALEFVQKTGVDSLAISIGTSHGVYKSNASELRFDILEKIQEKIPQIPLVLHGASSVGTDQINKFKKSGGILEKAGGIADHQLQNAAQKTHIAKVNCDTDLRLACTSEIRSFLNNNPDKFDPRQYMAKARENMTMLVQEKMKKILNSKDKIEC